MKTLADVRRRMAPGTRTRIVNHVRPEASGLRVVHKNQAKDIAWRTEDDKITWLKWPKADEIEIIGPDAVAFFVAGKPFLTITFEGAS